MPRKPKTATNGTALANVEPAAPPARQITRSQANAMLKSRALELYHEARTRREEQTRIFEAELRPSRSPRPHDPRGPAAHPGAARRDRRSPTARKLDQRRTQSYEAGRNAWSAPRVRGWVFGH